MFIQSVIVMAIKIKIFVITRFNNITSSLNNYNRYYLPIIIIIHLNVN